MAEDSKCACTGGLHGPPSRCVRACVRAWVAHMAPSVLAYIKALEKTPKNNCWSAHLQGLPHKGGWPADAGCVARQKGYTLRHHTYDCHGTPRPTRNNEKYHDKRKCGFLMRKLLSAFLARARCLPPLLLHALSRCCNVLVPVPLLCWYRCWWRLCHHSQTCLHSMASRQVKSQHQLAAHLLPGSKAAVPPSLPVRSQRRHDHQPQLLHRLRGRARRCVCVHAL